MKNRKYLAKVKLLSSHNYVINTLITADSQFKMDTISENSNLARKKGLVQTKHKILAT
jgi:hypothetical protein